MTDELAPVTQEREDKRNPDVQAVIDKFEQAMSLKMPRPQFQRRAAKTLIQRHGLDTVLKVIDAVVVARGQEYAPQILSLEDLRDKWNKLAEYYRRRKQETRAYRRTPSDV